MLFSLLNIWPFYIHIIKTKIILDVFLANDSINLIKRSVINIILEAWWTQSDLIRSEINWFPNPLGMMNKDLI